MSGPALVNDCTSPACVGGAVGTGPCPLAALPPLCLTAVIERLTCPRSAKINKTRSHCITWKQKINFLTTLKSGEKTLIAWCEVCSNCPKWLPGLKYPSNFFFSPPSSTPSASKICQGSSQYTDDQQPHLAPGNSCVLYLTSDLWAWFLLIKVRDLTWLPTWLMVWHGTVT